MDAGETRRPVMVRIRSRLEGRGEAAGGARRASDMSNSSAATDVRNERPASSVQSYARVAGVLLLVSVVAGSFGELYAPSNIIVSGDAAATARNLIAFESLFRVGFAAYLVEAICDITLALIFYMLLKPVDRNLALLAAFFGLVSTAVFAVSELFYFAAPLFLGDAEYLKAFTPSQRNTLALLSLRFYGYSGALPMALYGLASVLRGYLIFRSSFLPRLLGVLLAIGGLGFVTRTLAFILAPAYASDGLLVPMAPAGVSLVVWLLAKGVDVAKWEAQSAARR